MLYLLCALPCEARPLIDLFKLKKLTSHHAFPVYSNHNDIFLVVTGIGKMHAATACTYLLGSHSAKQHPVILNIGCAGHRSLPIGSPLAIHKIASDASDNCYYPTFACDCPFPRKALKTVSKLLPSYEEEYAYDMEVHGFYPYACRFSTVELVHCFKVISDNAQSRIDQVDEKRVQTLLEQHMASFEQWVLALMRLRQESCIEPFSVSIYEHCLQKWHFTETEQNQLSVLLTRLQACGILLDPSHTVFSISQPKQALRYLEEAVNQHPLSYGQEHV
jgi:adenosylhomocysteine nucleosidase